jgi:ribonuclease Z
MTAGGRGRRHGPRAIVPVMDLRGGSVAGVQTCIEVPSFGLLLDVGACSKTAVSLARVLVSHGHLDHVGAITQHAARRAMMKMGESTYLLPRSIARDAEALFHAAGALDGQVIPRRLVPLEPGEDFPLDEKRWVRPFSTFHRVPSQGYTIWERRHRLRSELRGRPPAELAELRRRGVALDEPYDAALLSFTGDTRIEVLEQVPELRSTETLVIECSFLHTRTPAEAHEMGHIHLDDLLARADLLTARSIVLHHFSARYAAGEPERVVRSRLPEALQSRVRVFPAPSDGKVEHG